MSTLTVKLPKNISAALSAAARRGSRTKSAVVRNALERYLAASGSKAQGSALDLAGDLVGRIRGPSDLSTAKRHLDGFGR